MIKVSIIDVHVLGTQIVPCLLVILAVINSLVDCVVTGQQFGAVIVVLGIVYILISIILIGSNGDIGLVILILQRNHEVISTTGLGLDGEITVVGAIVNIDNACLGYVLTNTV